MIAVFAGLVQGYHTEKQDLEQTIQSLEEKQVSTHVEKFKSRLFNNYQHAVHVHVYTCSDVTTVCAQEALIAELERAQSRLGVLEAASGQLAEREQQLQHQRQLLTDSLGHEEQGTSRAHAVVCPFTQDVVPMLYVCRQLVSASVCRTLLCAVFIHHSSSKQARATAVNCSCVFTLFLLRELHTVHVHVVKCCVDSGLPY